MFVKCFNQYFFNQNEVQFVCSKYNSQIDKRPSSIFSVFVLLAHIHHLHTKILFLPETGLLEEKTHEARLK